MSCLMGADDASLVDTASLQVGDGETERMVGVATVESLADGLHHYISRTPPAGGDHQEIHVLLGGSDLDTAELEGLRWARRTSAGGEPSVWEVCELRNDG